MPNNNRLRECASRSGPMGQLRAAAHDMIASMRLGIAHHFGWAVAVTASSDFEVVDRRRIELIGRDLPAAPIHHEGGTHPMHGSGVALDDNGLRSLVKGVRASVRKMASAALDEIQGAVPEPITVMALRAWPADFPEDIAILRHPPYESRADSVMYCKVLGELARAHGWALSTYDAKTVEAQAARILGDRANEVLHGPRTTLGPPWSKDHRMALAATILTS